LEKTRSKKARRYCCSNPNCHKVFSRPKVIKYYVCPSCQTLVDLPVEKTPIRPILREKRVLIEEQLTLGKPKSIKKTQEEEPISLTLIEPEKNIEVAVAEIPIEKQIETESVDEKYPQPTNLTLIEPEKNIEETPPTPTLFDLNEKPEATTTETANPFSGPQCLHYFGYLNQREKGETIPETCDECSNLLECLLSEHHGSEKSIKEIKKWYSLKR
jgi:hypothetical protein